MRFKLRCSCSGSGEARHVWCGRAHHLKKGQKYVRLDTLEKLLRFCQDHGDMIIGWDGKEWEIEIYDDYRE